jgi:hypothetical protein
LLRSVQLDNVFVAEWKRLTLPEHAVRLVEGEDSVVMAFVTDPGHRYVIMAFDMLDTNLPMGIPFPILLQNSVMYLASGGLLEEGRLVHPGETLSIPVPPGAEDVTIKRPDGTLEDIEVDKRHTVTFARTHDCGVYKAEFDDPDETVETFAANLLEPVESNIVPNDDFTIGAEKVVAVSGETKVNEPLWPWAAAAALLILLIEWWIYNKRVMI